MKNDLKKEADRYDLPSLIKLQDKRRENVVIFEQSIKNERAASQQEESAQSNLETKLRYHDLGIAKLTETDKDLILTDVPKLKSTREKREATIKLLKTAILEEQASMDREEQMIHYLGNRDGSKE